MMKICDSPKTNMIKKYVNINLSNYNYSYRKGPHITEQKVKKK